MPAQITADAITELRRMRAFFFVFIGAGGFVIPFINLYFSRTGMSGAQIGVLSMLAAVSSMVLAPIWGRSSDRTGRTRLLLQAGLLGSAIAALAIWVQDSFTGFAYTISVHSLFAAGTIPLSTALAMRTVSRFGAGGFGGIRRWGSLGWAVFVLAAGPLMQTAGLWIIFPAYAVMFLISAVMLLRIKPLELAQASIGSSGDVPQSPQRSGARQVAGTLFHTRSLFVFMVVVVVTGILNTGWRSFWQIYMDELQAPEFLIAIGAMVGAAVEMPGMLWVDRWTARFGARWILLAALGLDAARLCAVLVWPFPATIVLVNAIGGISFSLVTIGTVVYILDFTPKEQSSTMLAIFTVTLVNLIVIIGAPLAGLAFDAVGAYWLYAIGVVGNLLGWVVLYLGGK